MDFSPKIVYQDDEFLLARKPHGIASSWGQEESFLNIIKKYSSDSYSSSLRRQGSEIPDQVRNDIWSHQISIFGEEGEYGLLNRLDNVTAGLLYFAKSYEAKAEYSYLQSQGKIIKTYYAQVYGIPSASFGRIRTPLYHHRDDATRMTTDFDSSRGKVQAVTTYWEKIPDSDLIKVHITSGCRHQIRCHLASIGYPIVWDRLYMTKWLKKLYPDVKGNKIELVSAGLEILK